MNYLTSFLSAICASAVFIGALYMICPDGSISRSVTYILGLVFILCVTAASGITVKKQDIDFSNTEISLQDTQQSLTATAEFVYANALKSAEIEFSEITVCTNKTESGSINISKIKIVSCCPEEKITAALGEAAVAYEVEITNE